MFKKMASDALGLSDIGKIIDPADYDQTDADDYVRHEDDEKIYFLIKTKMDEYCFTNLGVIHVDGEKATSSKRTLKRFSYTQYEVNNVLLETAGTIDIDIQIKFNMGNVPFVIDVQKNEIDRLKDLYKALLFISEQAHENKIISRHAEQSLDKAVQILQNSRLAEGDTADQYKTLTEFSFDWYKNTYEQYQKQDYGEIFERYINN